MTRRLLLLLLLAIAASAAPAADGDKVLIYGASGRIGQHIVDEALKRGYAVTGVSRDASRLANVADHIDIVTGDILDRERTAELIASHDVVIVSIGGAPRDADPARYIAALAAESLIDVLAPMGDDGPRLIFVGNLFTLIYEDGKTLLELGRVPESHENYAMFHGHQIALDRFRASTGVNWTIATPPNGLRLEGRTGKVRWGGDELLRDPDGTPSGISREDFAYAVLEELENGNYVRARFNVAR
ncbi:MAG: NAD(P)H-binding protein [Pseudomonadota bacterium]